MELKKRGTRWVQKVVETVGDHHEEVKFNENADGTFSLTFKEIPALLFISYDGLGSFDQLFVHGEDKPEAQGIRIESTLGELTTYSIDFRAIIKTSETREEPK